MRKYFFFSMPKYLLIDCFIKPVSIAVGCDLRDFSAFKPGNLRATRNTRWLRHSRAWTQMAHRLPRSPYAPQGGDRVFHSDGCGSPSGHHKLVYSSFSSEERSKLGSAVDELSSLFLLNPHGPTAIFPAPNWALDWLNFKLCLNELLNT